jgi:uncharacterized protein YkwD
MVVIVVLLFSTAVVGAPASEQIGQLRLVQSSLGQDERALALSTKSLYARNDLWKSYLATEAVCPGGERTDLPAERQVATVACLVNYARGRRGLRPLAARPALALASVRKAREIIRCGNFDHSPCGGDWKASVRSTGYPGVFGENLYLASGRWGAPRVAVDAWLNSRDHRENLFAAKWREQGFALLRNEDFGIYRGVAIWVSVFGDR